MLLKKAFEKAKESQEIKEKCIDNNYNLTAAMSILKSSSYKVEGWTLIYYNEKKHKTMQVIIKENEKMFEIKEPEEPLKPSTKKLELKKIKTNSDKMLEKAKKQFLEFHKPLSQIIINLSQNQGVPTWRFSFITKTLELVTVEINAETGEIMKKEKQKLVK